MELHMHSPTSSVAPLLWPWNATMGEQDLTSLGFYDLSMIMLVGDTTWDRWSVRNVTTEIFEPIKIFVSLHEAITGPSELFSSFFIRPGTEDREDPMTGLALAAEMKDEETFLQAAAEIDWRSMPASDFERAVRLALAAGSHRMARMLAARGARLYPDDPQMQKISRLLAPPRILRANLPPDETARANHEWLKAHADQYLGRWVALKNGELLAQGATAREVKDQLEDTEEVLITRVF